MKTYIGALLFAVCNLLSAGEPIDNGFPKVAFGKDGAQVTLSIMTPDALFFEIKYDNFLPNEKITLLSRSATEVLSSPITLVSPPPVYSISPAVVGQTGGTSSITVQRADNEEITIDFNWGDAVPGAKTY